MLNVCHFNPIPGTIDFSQNFTFNFCRQSKHDVRSLRYVSKCFVEGR